VTLSYRPSPIQHYYSRAQSFTLPGAAILSWATYLDSRPSPLAGSSQAAGYLEHTLDHPFSFIENGEQSTINSKEQL
jgi:hypothetical protein